MSENLIDLSIAGLLAFWVLLALHYAPWDRLLGRKLPPPWTYIVGTTAWASVYAGWLVLTGQWSAVAMLVVVIAAAGLAVLGAYALDGLLALKHEHAAQRGDLQDLEQR